MARTIPPARAAALGAAAGPAPRPPTLRLHSAGRCLVYGRGQVAIEVGAALSGRLAVTVCLDDVADAMPLPAVPRLVHGQIQAVRGHFTAFEVTFRWLAAALSGPRPALAFAMRQAGAVLATDIIVDLTGDRSLFPGCAERDGYVRANPSDGLSLARALLAASELTGDLEKPLYVAYSPSACAHARNHKTGCTRCLDHCPTGAITPNGDHVAIDAGICEGCGACAAQCPTGAIGYQMPPDRELIGKARALIEAYVSAGGEHPTLVVHEPEHGGPILDAIDCYGVRPPLDAIPFAVDSVARSGHDLLLGLLTAGAGNVVLLVPPRHRGNFSVLELQVSIACAILDGLGHGPRISIATEDDPEKVEALIDGLVRAPALPRSHFGLIGSKRELARSILAALDARPAAERTPLPLPAGAPYGRVVLADSRCTLCLSCVGACPTGALRDDPDRPALSFIENACVQCGICIATCPEAALSLDPRLELTNAALGPAVLKAEQPCRCTSCGKPFGTRSSVERVKRALSGNTHFRSEQSLALLDLCADCRVVAMFAAKEPMATRPPPPVVTSEDYLAANGPSADGRGSR